jgi:hypothetical protein
MYVVKRDGRQETVHFDKITARLKKLSYGLSQDHCDPVLVAQKVCAGVYKGVTTSQLDELAAETAAAMTASHPDYASVRNTTRNPLPLVSLLLFVCSVLTWGWLLPLFSVVVREAGGEDCCVEPAQEHKEVLLGDVSNG